MEYQVTFNDVGDYTIVLPAGCDLNDLAALSPIIQAIREFGEPRRMSAAS